MKTHQAAAATGLPATATALIGKLGSPILNLQNTARALDIVARATIHERGGFMVDKIKKRCPEFAGYTVIVMTEDEAEAASFLTTELIERAHDVAKLFETAADGEAQT
ncbi:hypothetical protein [Bosea rubneri]|uniref:Uncharacterized protein n=1 Tax=Bosea rubneri TaxID=3075434 RepID=A0ABU3S446_9HYPH|nr:hypothetical protein [Bosea sp. ZW T0_25]MDU0339559.1 hypothetical protein [Bosea sp. ZW T0_25]